MLIVFVNPMSHRKGGRRNVTSEHTSHFPAAGTAGRMHKGSAHVPRFRLKSGEISAAVHGGEHLDAVHPHTINDPVPLKNQLPDIPVRCFRHLSPQFREVDKSLCRVNQPLHESRSVEGLVLCDVIMNGL